MIIKNFTIILLSITLISFLSSCSQNKRSLNLAVNFPKNTPVLSKKEKTELKKNIAIKNADLFTEEEIKELLGELEIEIK